VPGSELKNGPRNFQQHYAQGDELELRVIRFDQGRKDIVLSETAKDRDEAHAERQAERREKQREQREQKKAVRDYQDSPTTGPTTLGELSGLGDLKSQMEEAERSEARQRAEAKAQEAVEEVEAAGADDAGTDASDEEAANGEAGGAPTGTIPDDFPQAARLESAGITTFDELLQVEELTDISGIGPAYADQIKEALDEHQASS